MCENCGKAFNEGYDQGRVKTLEEVRKIGESYGQFLNSSFMFELNRLIAEAKEGE